MPYGDIKAVEAQISKNTCGVLVEPIQGEGGVIVPPPGYLKAAFDLCQQNKVLFIADEIQTGFCRTGRFFACEHFDLAPDIMTVAKAMPKSFGTVTSAVGCLINRKRSCSRFWKVP